jgi:serine palmitoyltransferase
MRDFFGKRFRPLAYEHLMAHNGYAPLNSDFDSFYTRRFKGRIDDCFSQPVTGVAGRTIVILNRTTDDYNVTQTLTGGRTRTLNISSYNYLGFAQAQGGCADAVEESLRQYGVCAGGARLEGGTSDLHVQSEALVAKFLGTEDALISSMGFATNSTFIPALVGKGCLVISDELNHSSIRIGVRFSGADVRTFKHNDMKSLESLLRDVVSQGQRKTHRQWKKIMIIVEGLYSMEGTLVNLPAIIELKKKYKFFLFVDEAHSIGAIGPHGRGVCDYFNIPPRSVDVLMGTFTKSFGAAGGYIAGSKDLINSLRIRGHSGTYAEAMTPPVLAQLVASMASIMGIADSCSQDKTLNTSDYATPHMTSVLSKVQQHPGPAPASSLPIWMNLPAALRDGSEGRSRLRRLAFNSRYLHCGLTKLGFITYGHPSSPIVPLLVFNLGKLPLFHRMMKDRATPIVVVVVAYPATSLVSGRVRFCLSAAHTKDDVDLVLKACDEIGEVLDLKHGQGERWCLEDILSRSVELVNQ